MHLRYMRHIEDVETEKSKNPNTSTTLAKIVEDHLSHDEKGSHQGQTAAKKMIHQIVRNARVEKQVEYAVANLRLLGRDESEITSLELKRQEWRKLQGEELKLQASESKLANLKLQRQRTQANLSRMKLQKQDGAVQEDKKLKRLKQGIKTLEKKVKESKKALRALQALRDKLKKALTEELERHYVMFLNNPVDSALWKETAKKVCRAEIRNTGKETSIWDKKVIRFTRYPTKLEMRDLLRKNVANNLFVKDKTTGANEAGMFGGEYLMCFVVEGADGQAPTFHTQRSLIKQDAPAKDVIEYFLSRFVNQLIGNSGASVNHIFAGKVDPATNLMTDEREDDLLKSGDDVYTQSIYYEPFDELYQAVYKAEGREPPADRPKLLGWFNRSQASFLTSAANMIGYPHDFNEEVECTGLLRHHMFNPQMHLRNGGDAGPEMKESELNPKFKDFVLGDCRFLDFPQVIFAPSMGGDFDSHPANLGVESVLDEKGREILVYKCNSKGYLLAEVDEIKDGKKIQKDVLIIDPVTKKPIHLMEQYEKGNANDGRIPIMMYKMEGKTPGKTPVLDENKKHKQEVLKRLRRIDYGGGLRRARRQAQLPYDVDMHSKADHIWAYLGLEPFNHNLDYDALLKISPYFADELARMGIRSGNVTYDHVAAWVHTILGETVKFYGLAPLKAFAERMDKRSLGLKNVDNEQHLLQVLELFLTRKLYARQLSMSRFELEIRMSCATHVKDEKIVANPALDALIRENPTYFLGNHFHFRHPRQKEKSVPTSAVKAYANSILQQDNQKILGLLRSDFNHVTDIKLRAEIFIARLNILARFIDDEKERHHMLEVATSLQFWLNKYRRVFKDTRNVRRNNIVFLSDTAFQMINQKYDYLLKQSPLLPAVKAKIKELMTIDGFFNLAKSSEQERYAKSFTKTAQTSGNRVAIIAQDEMGGRTPPKKVRKDPAVYNHRAPVFFPQHAFSYDKSQMSREGVIAISGLLATMDKATQALVALSATLDLFLKIRLSVEDPAQQQQQQQHQSQSHSH